MLFVEIAVVLVGMGGLLLGVYAAIQANGAKIEARRSADASEASARTAADALEIQRSAHNSQEAERRQRLLADVVPVKWESRAAYGIKIAGVQPYVGLVLTNRGPAVASNVRGECLMGDSWRAGDVASLMPGQTHGLRDELHDIPRPVDFVFDDPYEPRDVIARATWTNQDGSETMGTWVKIQRF